MTTILTGRAFFAAALADITAARGEILLATYKITPTRQRPALVLTRTLHALEQAARRGVRVQVIAPGPGSRPGPGKSNIPALARLAAAGAEIRTAGASLTFHAKILIIDQVVLYLGSHNMTPGSALINYEMSARITHQPAVTAARRSFLAAGRGLPAPPP